MVEDKVVAVALVSLSLALAGCVGGDGDDAPDAGASSAPTGGGTSSPAPGLGPAPGPAPITTLTHLGCSQDHLFFAAPWALFGDAAPEGFGPDGTDPTGATTTVYIHVSFCNMPDPVDPSVTREIAEAWVGLRVTPPAEYANPEAVVHLIPFDVIVSDATLAAVYLEWGFQEPLIVGSIERTETAGPEGRTATIVLDRGGAGTYTLRTLMGPPQEGSAAGTDRLFAVSDGTVTGWFDYTWPGWTDVGSGSVVFSSEGVDGAPPAAPGMAHQVSETDVVLTYVALPT